MRTRLAFGARRAEVARAGPIAERARHPPEIAVAGEWPRYYGRASSEQAQGPRMAREPRETVHRAPRLSDVARERDRRQAVALAFLPAQMEQDARNVDLHWTDITAGAAQRRGEGQMSRRRAEQIRTHDRPDRSRVGRPVGVTADPAVDRAHVEAGSAAQAVERLAEHGVGQHPAAPVIDHHDMNFARAVQFVGAARTVDEVGVAGQFLAGRGARENLQEMTKVRQFGDYFLDPHQRDQRFGKRAGEAAVALILDQHERAGFSDREIDAGHAHFGAQENRAQPFAGGGREQFRFGRVRDTELLGEELADILARKMNRRCDDMGRRFVAELNDIFTEVGLDRLDAGRRQRGIELDFLGGHRFAFDHPLGAGSPGHCDDIVAGLGGVRGDKDFAAVGFETIFQLDQQLVEMLDGCFLDPPGGVAFFVVSRKFGAGLRDLMEMVTGCVFQLAAQFKVSGGGAARGKKIVR